jgi:hypothetical protein
MRPVSAVRRTPAGDLTAVIRRHGVAPDSAEGAKIHHAAGGRPGERVIIKGAGRCEAIADNLAAVVYRAGAAVRTTSERADVYHPARRRPRERMFRAVRDDKAGLTSSEPLRLRLWLSDGVRAEEPGGSLLDEELEAQAVRVPLAVRADPSHLHQRGNADGHLGRNDLAHEWIEHIDRVV